MLLRIIVKPNSKTDQVILQEDGSIRVKIKAPPVDGKANKYLIRFLADFFDIPRSQVELIKGETSSHKTIAINATQQQIDARLKHPND
jgi:uncharacterized protein (TIGR00251 family)